MVYEQFLAAVKKRMEAELGSSYELELHKVPKNNGLILDGLCITRGNAHIAPAIYLNPCYDQYRKGMSLDQIVAELLTMYRQNDTPPPLNYEMLSDYEGIRSNIACKLIHAASNEAILKDVPYIPWMDLAIVFYLCIHEDDTGLMTAMIHNSHLRIWNISLEDLKTSALSNSPRLFPPVISSMACIIEEMNRGLNPHFQETHPKPETPAPFYVLSNRSGINGAACILYEDVLKNFADGVEKNLIILPPSIHEVLLLPDDGDISYEEMSRLVTHINRSEVPEEDRLSNQVYLYSRETGEVTMASSGPASIC